MSRSHPSPLPKALAKHVQRFQELRRGLDQLEYFCKGTVLKRMTKCGKAYCACRADPNKRHAPYFELTYKVEGKTVSVRLSAEAAPLYRAASAQFRKLKTTLQRFEKISPDTVLTAQWSRLK